MTPEDYHEFKSPFSRSRVSSEQVVDPSPGIPPKSKKLSLDPRVQDTEFIRGKN